MRLTSFNSCAALLMIVMQLTLCSLLINPADASPLPAPVPNGDDLQHKIIRTRYCGRKLTETLALICQGRYPMMSNHRSEYLSDQPQPPVHVEVATLPNRANHGFPYSRSFEHRRFKRAGIYDECCKKSCSYHELKSYCE